MTSLYATETVWDGGVSRTGLSGDGRFLTVGSADGAWAPEHLLLLGAESSVMDSFLAVAREADIRILGYMSSGHLGLPEDLDARLRLTVQPCVVVGSWEEAERIALLSPRAAERSVAGRLLGDRLRVVLDVRVESACGDPGPWVGAAV
jgi:hypothetical protein